MVYQNSTVPLYHFTSAANNYIINTGNTNEIERLNERILELEITHANEIERLNQRLQTIQNRERSANLNNEINKTIRNIQHMLDHSLTYRQLYDRLRKMRWYYNNEHHGDSHPQSREILTQHIDTWIHHMIEVYYPMNAASNNALSDHTTRHHQNHLSGHLINALKMMARDKMTLYEAEVQGGLHPRRNELDNM